MNEVVFRYLHFLGIMVLSSALVAEHLLIAPQIAVRQIRKVVVIDAIYGVGAVLVLAAGLMLWFVVGKPAQYYSGNWIFLTKLSLFIVVALLSIYPTLFFLRKRKSQQDRIDVPRSIIMTVRAEILLLLLIPLLAVLMARGYGVV